MHLTRVYLFCHLYAKNFHSCWKFDSFDKNTLHSFIETRCTCILLTTGQCRVNERKLIKIVLLSYMLHLSNVLPVPKSSEI